DLSRLLKRCPVNRGEGCLFVDGERFDVAPQFPVNRVPQGVRLPLPPPHDLVDQPLRGWLILEEPLVVGIEKPIPVGHFTFDAELANMDYVRLNQGIPDGGESLLGDELHEVVTLQVDEAVAPSEMDPAHVDPVKQISGVVTDVPQLLGQMNVGVEGVRYVEDDPLAEFLG